MFSSNSIFLFVELFVELHPLGDEAQQVEISQEAGGVVEHPGLAVVVAVVGIAAVVSRTREVGRLTTGSGLAGTHLCWGLVAMK